MLRFKVFDNGQPAPQVCLDGAHLVGSEGVPLRAELSFHDGEVRATKRAPGPASLVLLWPVSGFGRLVLETTRLMERERPYNLHVELARGRLMRISQKREDWGLFDYPDGSEFYRRVADAKAKLVDAMTTTDDVAAAMLADDALAESVAVGEELSLFHADIFLKRRRATHQFVKRPLGVGVSLGRSDEPYRGRLTDAFDFAALPMPWRELEPREDAPRWDPVDMWVNWLGKRKMHVRGGPLVSFERSHLPEWVMQHEEDYERVRDATLQHVLKLVKRFAHRVQSWEVVCGAHAFNTFHFTLEQLMEVTRAATQIVKHNAPRSAAIVTIVVPWGEYYARDVRTIPPWLYADMCVQSGLNFDAFGLQFQFGAPVEGMLVRDMLQISSAIDRYANFGKPLHLTAVQVPSTPIEARSPDSPVAGGGVWHEPWSETIQARWLREFYEIGFSKPFVETICWRDLSDGPGRLMPTGGLLRADLAAKPAYDALLSLRRSLVDARGAHRTRA